MANRLILVDGSSYLFRAYHALPALTNSKGLNTGAAKGVIGMIRKLVSDYAADQVVVVFDAEAGGIDQIVGVSEKIVVDLDQLRKDPKTADGTWRQAESVQLWKCIEWRRLLLGDSSLDMREGQSCGNIHFRVRLHSALFRCLWLW